MNIIEKYDKPFEYFAAFMQLMLAYQFFNLWYSPELGDIYKIGDFAVLMAFEFIMVHSGVFMSVLPKKISLYIFVPIYALFALIMNTFVSDNSVIIIYGLVVFNRMRFAFSDVSKVVRNRNVLFSILGALLYFILAVLFSVLNDRVPPLGLTEDFLNTSGYFNTLKSEGLFVEKPFVPLAMGSIYYLILCLIEIKFAGSKNNSNTA